MQMLVRSKQLLCRQQKVSFLSYAVSVCLSILRQYLDHLLVLQDVARLTMGKPGVYLVTFALLVTQVSLDRLQMGLRRQRSRCCSLASY